MEKVFDQCVDIVYSLQCQNADLILQTGKSFNQVTLNINAVSIGGFQKKHRTIEIMK